MTGVVCSSDYSVETASDNTSGSLDLTPEIKLDFLGVNECGIPEKCPGNRNHPPRTVTKNAVVLVIKAVGRQKERFYNVLVYSVELYLLDIDCVPVVHSEIITCDNGPSRLSDRCCERNEDIWSTRSTTNVLLTARLLMSFVRRKQSPAWYGEKAHKKL